MILCKFWERTFNEDVKRDLDLIKAMLSCNHDSAPSWHEVVDTQIPVDAR